MKRCFCQADSYTRNPTPPSDGSCGSRGPPCSAEKAEFEFHERLDSIANQLLLSPGVAFTEEQLFAHR